MSHDQEKKGKKKRAGSPSKRSPKKRATGKSKKSPKKKPTQKTDQKADQNMDKIDPDFLEPEETKSPEDNLENSEEKKIEKSESPGEKPSEKEEASEETPPQKAPILLPPPSGSYFSESKQIIPPRKPSKKELAEKKKKGDFPMADKSQPPVDQEKNPLLTTKVRIGLAVLAGLVLSYVFIWRWCVERIYVPPNSMLVLNLKMGEPNKDPGNMRVVPEGVQGIQKIVLGEGRYFYNPLFYDRNPRFDRTFTFKVVEIGPQEVGIVTSKSGKPLPPGQFLASKEGEKGTWERVLTPGKWRLNPFAYKVEKKGFVQIQPGFVGCVTAKSGVAPRENPSDYLSEAYGIFQKLQKAYPFEKNKLNQLFQQISSTYRQMNLADPWLLTVVEIDEIRHYWDLQKRFANKDLTGLDRKKIAKQMDGFQKSVLKGLETREKNLDKLKGLERYYQSLFLLRAYKILGQKALVIIKDIDTKPKSPIVPRLIPPAKLLDDLNTNRDSYEKLMAKLPRDQKKWNQAIKAFQMAVRNTGRAFRGEILSKKGEKGIQKEVLQPGTYYLNPHKYHVDVVEIGYRQFSSKGVRFPSKDGFPLTLDISVVWGLLPGNVPYLIKKYGNIKDIDRTVIQPQVENICKNFGSKYEAKQFIDGETRKEFQLAFTGELERVCQDRRIDVLIGLVRDIVVPDQVKRPIQKGKIADLERDMKVEQQKTQKVQNQLVELQKEVERGVRNVEAETAKQIANIKAETGKVVAEIAAQTEVEVARVMKEAAKWQAMRSQILGEADADVTKMIKQAQADQLRQNIRALGGAKAYANYIFTQNLPENFRIYIRYAGPGTFWTDLPKGLKMVEKAASLKILSEKKRK